MATKRLCSVEGCGKRHFGHGWCVAHYKRWRRYGDPLSGGPPATKTGTSREWLLDHAGHEGDDCIEWPFSRANYGYGEILIKGRKRLAHRIMCELVHGPAPEGKNDAAHSCNNRLCVNPRHLQWKSRAGNEADKLFHGTDNRGERHGMSKLTENDVRNIRALVRTMRRKEIAQRFAVSCQTVDDIINRKRWSWLE